MRDGKSLFVVIGAFVLAMTSTRAEADSLSCPSPLQPGQNNTYTVTNTGTTRPVDCVWGDGNLAVNNNDFLDGNGHNDLGNSLVPLFTEVPPHPETFNLSFTFIGSTGSWNNGPGTAITGLTFSNSTNTSTSFSINPALAGFTNYALGVKDGAAPQWAVFLLQTANGGLSGTASM